MTTTGSYHSAELSAEHTKQQRRTRKHHNSHKANAVHTPLFLVSKTVDLDLLCRRHLSASYKAQEDVNVFLQKLYMKCIKILKSKIIYNEF